MRKLRQFYVSIGVILAIMTLITIFAFRQEAQTKQQEQDDSLTPIQLGVTNERQRINNSLPPDNIQNINQTDVINFKTLNSLRQYGVELIQPNDANFNQEFTQYVGGNNLALSIVEAAKPFVVLIKNNSSKDIIGVSLRWTFTKSNGEQKSIPQIESTPGVLMGEKAHDVEGIGNTNLLSARNIGFFSYFNSSLSPFIKQFHWQSKIPNLKSQNIPVSRIENLKSFLDSQKIILLKDVSNLTVSIDGIVLSDGVFVGEDQNFFFDSLSAEIKAWKDTKNILRKAKEKGKTDEDSLLEVLSQQQPEQNQINDSLFPRNPKEAFDRSYNRSINKIKREIAFRKNKIPGSKIVSEYLSIKDLDLITLRKIK